MATYRSAEEVEKTFFPDFYKKKLEESMDVKVLAIRDADKILKKAKQIIDKLPDNSIK